MSPQFKGPAPPGDRPEAQAAAKPLNAPILRDTDEVAPW
jgi:hypothetical protein